MPRYLKAMQLGRGAGESVDGTDGILCFSVGHEVEARSASETHDIRNAKKYNFIAA
jgi:hypothetical protein